MSLLFLALSASVDRFLRVTQLEPGAIHRPHDAVEVAGGKALNAARAARLLGAEAHAVALAGGHTGAWLRELIEGSGLDVDWVPAAKANRICTSVADDDGQLTELYEPAPEPSDGEWRSFVERTRSRVASGGYSWAALAGSLPLAVGSERIAEILTGVHAAGARVAVDLRDEALRVALAAGVDLVKVNAREARRFVGRDLAVPVLAEALLDRLVGDDPWAIVTDGPRGAVLAARAGTWEAKGPPAGSWSVGSGDSFFGAVLASRTLSSDPVAALRTGIGAGAANTLRPGAANFDLATHRTHRDAAQVRPITSGAGT